MIYRLIFFNFDLFQWVRGLNPNIFKEVKKYLSTGNVNGIFNRLLSASETLILKVTAWKKWGRWVKMSECSTVKMLK
jgi:hypothetical protein